MDVTTTTDEMLMARYARGEARAFEELYCRHELKIWRYLERNLGNRAAAEELLQEVWFAVARDSARYQPSARFTTWLFTIAHHRMIDWLRANRRLVSLEELGEAALSVLPPLIADPSAGPLAVALARDAAAAVMRAVEALPAEQRAAFLLQVEGEMSVEEIAAITHSSFETTKSRLRYARAKLRELLKEYA